MMHCIAKINTIVAEGQGDRRSILQLGYNLGRLSELTGLGRGPFWDRWKEPVATWNVTALEGLARELQALSLHPISPSANDHPADGSELEAAPP